MKDFRVLKIQQQTDLGYDAAARLLKKRDARERADIDRDRQEMIDDALISEMINLLPADRIKEILEYCGIPFWKTTTIEEFRGIIRDMYQLGELDKDSIRLYFFCEGEFGW